MHTHGSASVIYALRKRVFILQVTWPSILSGFASDLVINPQSLLQDVTEEAILE